MMSSTIVIVLTLLCGVEIYCQRPDIVYESESLEDDGSTVLLGGLFPLHVTGDDAPCTGLQDFAIQELEAMIFAINSVNNDPSLLPNTTLAFSIRDTCSNPKHALEETFKYVQDKNITCGNTSEISVSGVVGAAYSRVSMHVANLLRLYRIPQISFISTADILSDKTRFDYFFRTVPPDILQARAIADIILMFNWTYVFALHSDDAYGNGGIEALIDELEKQNPGICIAKRIPLSVTANDTDYDKALQTMSEDWVQNAAIAVLFGDIEAATGMMEAIIRKKNSSEFVLDKLTWIGTDGWGDSLDPKYHSIARGMLSVIPRAEESKEFDDYYTSLHPANYTSNPWFIEFWEHWFNCSMSKGTCDLESEHITLNTTDHEQISHVTLVIDAVMAFAHSLHSLIESYCNDGRLCEDILVLERLVGRAVEGELIRQYLYNVSFKGASSNTVSFDAKGDEKGAYFVKNLQQVSENKFSFEIVGIWDYVTSLNITSDIQWVTGGDVPESICSRPCKGGQEPRREIPDQQCCWRCSPCQSEKGYSDGLSQCKDCNESFMYNSERTGCVPIPISFLKWSDPWAVILLIATNVGLMVTTCVIVVFIVYREHKIIKASSRELSAILLAGLVMGYLMPYFFISEPSGAICGIRRFGLGFSFALCYSPLLIKTNRIHRIFNQKSLRPNRAPRFTTPLSQVILTFILISIQIVIATIWLAVEPPSSKIIYKARTAELRCGESPLIGLAVSLGYNLLLLVLSTYFAFLARKVPENFNEAKYINITLYTLCIIWLAFIPTYIGTVELGAVYQTSSLTVAIVLSATSTLACIFMPKVIMLFTWLRKGEKKHTSRITETNNTTNVTDATSVDKK